MQMAYLDARLQEPSNRGLSDSDIKNALTRIGINTFDPMVFARRQQQILRRLNGKLDNLGIELSGTEQVRKGEPGEDGTVRGFVYQKEFVNKIRSSLGSASSKIDQLISGQTAAANDLSTLSLDDLKRQIAEEEARQ